MCEMGGLRITPGSPRTMPRSENSGGQELGPLTPPGGKKRGGGRRTTTTIPLVVLKILTFTR